jgi:hypothetical protein
MTLRESVLQDAPCLLKMVLEGEAGTRPIECMMTTYTIADFVRSEWVAALQNPDDPKSKLPIEVIGHTPMRCTADAPPKAVWFLPRAFTAIIIEPRSQVNP